MGNSQFVEQTKQTKQGQQGQQSGFRHLKAGLLRKMWLSALYQYQADELAKAQEEARQFLDVILPQIHSGELMFAPDGRIISRAEYEAGCAANEAENEEYSKSHRL